MSKENRIIKQITVEDAVQVERVVQSLMGESVGPRKLFFEQNAKYTKAEI